MRAAVMQGIRQPLSCTSVPDPKPAEGELVVKVARCGICGSDLHIAEDPAFGKGAGYILGHEFAGEVAAVGRGTQGVAVGDLVSVIPLQSCGHCPACVAGEVAWCGQFGLQGGGYAEYAVTRPNQCIKLPQALSLADGAIIEPLAVALHGIHMSGLKFGEKVLILGAGPIGLAVAFWARRANSWCSLTIPWVAPSGQFPARLTSSTSAWAFLASSSRLSSRCATAARSCCWGCAPGPTHSTVLRCCRRKFA